MMLTNLDVTTPSDREIRVTRTFAAPRDLVFECLTKPELVQRWLLGPPEWSMPVCEIDLRIGGRYRYVWRNDENGTEFGAQGEFHEIHAPDRLVHAETMDGVPGKVTCTGSLITSGNGTLYTLTLQFDSRELRDSALESGMTGGMSISYERLDDTLHARSSA
jgi:uncharacterized protein YndB with AHSA1/START domain